MCSGCVFRSLRMSTVGSSSYVTDKSRSMESVERSLQTGDSKMVGGRWYPTRCVARHRIAVIVPYRNRTEHLRTLIQALHPFLQRQLLDYTIFVVEQVSNYLSNHVNCINNETYIVDFSVQTAHSHRLSTIIMQCGN